MEDELHALIWDLLDSEEDRKKIWEMLLAREQSIRDMYEKELEGWKKVANKAMRILERHDSPSGSPNF